MKAVRELDTIPNYKLKKRLSGGRSGDDLFILECDSTQYILKCSLKQELCSEITYTMDCYRLFEKLGSFNPIVKIHEYNVDPQYPCIVENTYYPYYYIMEYLGAYSSLSQCIQGFQNSQQLSEILLVYGALKSLLECICTMKKHGFSYCDLHPENVFVDREKGRIKLIDFGLVKREYAPCERSRFTTSRFQKLSPSYTHYVKSTVNLLIQELKENTFDSDIGMLLSILELVIPAESSKIASLFFYAQHIYQVMNSTDTESKEYSMAVVLNYFSDAYLSILSTLLRDG
jgi:serine/threonine protein kinase